MLEDCFGVDYSNIEEKCRETLKQFGDPLAKEIVNHARFFFQHVRMA